jgi:hypothetical protein
MTNRLILLVLPFLIFGCSQNIRLHDLDTKEKVPAISYEAYFFVTGLSERSRAVFLKKPDIEIAVEPASPEIVSTTATYPEAMTFMLDRRYMRSITTQTVIYKDKPLGYLLTYNQPGLDGEVVVTNLYERDGKIYFNAREVEKVSD